uniref:Large ribosomal subunit protein uL24 n=1 Tax=uncultured Berkelbacteria bacterium Rifle_16ft_4_minimus_38443 TaxID=1665092 RepID=A0A0H4T7B2_9BACT|nr:50S ribosomal protein L24, large subunit ribosomal protein L24 [uncultured Berkelbacteria bacterium Rifle_16ft_4_minimus_38443]
MKIHKFQNKNLKNISIKLKKGDNVLVISGKDRGKTGKIEKAFPKNRKVQISGINIIKKHVKPTKKNPKGGKVEIAVPITTSNLMLICPKCHKATRTGFKITVQKKVRICKKCAEEI